MKLQDVYAGDDSRVSRSLKDSDTTLRIPKQIDHRSNSKGRPRPKLREQVPQTATILKRKSPAPLMPPSCKRKRPDPPIDLLLGQPNPLLFPPAELASAFQRVLFDPTKSTPALLYGADEGYWPFRKSLSTWLNDFYGDARRSYAAKFSTSAKPACVHDAERGAARLTITGGASQSLGLILSTFTDPAWTQGMWIAAPAYYLSFKIFQDAGFTGKMKAVPEDNEGIDVEALRRQLQRLEKPKDTCANAEVTPQGAWRGSKPASLYEKVYRHVIYVVPTFANPSSRTMSLRRREQLVELAREYDALIICDDVYDMLQWPREEGGDLEEMKRAKLPRLVDIDRYLPGAPCIWGFMTTSFGNVVSNGSFSKILGPGIRTGWIEALPKFAHRLSQAGVQKSGGAPSQVASVAVNDMLEKGVLQTHIFTKLQPAYQHRWHILRRAIASDLEPLGVSIVEQQPEHGSEGRAGGFFIWIILPKPLDAEEVADRAKRKENLTVAPGSMFEVPTLSSHLEPDTIFPRCIRLCLAWEDVDMLDEGIRRLAKVVRYCLDDPAEASELESLA